MSSTHQHEGDFPGSPLNFQDPSKTSTTKQQPNKPYLKTPTLTKKPKIVNEGQNSISELQNYPFSPQLRQKSKSSRLVAHEFVEYMIPKSKGSCSCLAQ